MKHNRVMVEWIVISETTILMLMLNREQQKLCLLEPLPLLFLEEISCTILPIACGKSVLLRKAWTGVSLPICDIISQSCFVEMCGKC